MNEEKIVIDYKGFSAPIYYDPFFEEYTCTIKLDQYTLTVSDFSAEGVTSRIMTAIDNWGK